MTVRSIAMARRMRELVEKRESWKDMVKTLVKAEHWLGM